ncbi:hypothetical protein [Mucilaginibacter sp. L3T2-6]|uniref:hypothetical protein n=1 Tax=Mucilaginibacter sp. L3T2-6 TaxID=3062491 RepID=UPI002674CC9E|nr:hypothetical protein [Mucilaginibacter sp. L3T2-6]MDO3642615.1 hypothetical protein [Mucilaginibacter sp. L3T2-6]MDV6214989.1 hypothetical protein [Mucilaginibacter sp. L3T2-6]
MFAETKKLHIIEEILKIDNDNVLSALENFLKISGKGKEYTKKFDIKAFSGIWTKEEADEIEKIISASCETIHPDDWK